MNKIEIIDFCVQYLGKDIDIIDNNGFVSKCNTVLKVTNENIMVLNLDGGTDIIGYSSISQVANG